MKWKSDVNRVEGSGEWRVGSCFEDQSLRDDRLTR